MRTEQQERARVSMTVRERLLVAADELFYAEGITAVGVEKIRATAGVAKSSLYEHFTSKDQLVAAYLERRSLVWREHLRAALSAADPTAQEQLTTVFAELGRWFELPGFRGCPFINAAAELPAGHPAAAIAADHRAWITALLTTITQQAEAADPDLVARQLLMLYNASMVEAHAGSATAAADAGAAARQLLTSARA
jgi:AcrR family transcriptional regulator